MRKLTSRAFQKCGSLWVLKVLNPSYRLSKYGQIQRIFLLEWRCHKKKTRPQYWVLGSDTESAWAQHGWFHADSMAALKTHYCGRVFFLWRLLFLLTEPKFHSLLTLSSNNSRSKADTPNKFHIFGIVRTFSFTWFYPGYFFLWANFEESVFYGKRAFLAFFHDHTEKNSDNFDSNIIEVWWLAHSSFRNWCSTFYRTQVNLGSDLWVRMSVCPSQTNKHTLCRLNWIPTQY